MNLYGWSKQLFDLAGRERIKQGAKMPPQWAGLKFFNVFGPNEYHKGAMMSVLAKRFDDIKLRQSPCSCSSRTGTASPTATSGATSSMSRTWCAVILWLLASGNVNGIFNVGTGKARSFRDLIVAAYDALGTQPEHRICRYAARKFATAISISRKPPSIGCKPPATMAASLRLKTPSASMSEIFSINPIAIADRATEQKPDMFDFDALSKVMVRQTVLCVGDLMLDEFVYGEVSRISPEAPASVLAVKRSETNVGGAGNVARNITSLGARCIFVSLVGRDADRREYSGQTSRSEKLIEPALIVDR